MYAGFRLWNYSNENINDKDKAIEIMNAMVNRTKLAGGEVVKLLETGSAFYSPASSAFRNGSSILLPMRKELISNLCIFERRIRSYGFYVGVPAVLGANGVEKVIEFSINEEENHAFTVLFSAVKRVDRRYCNGWDFKYKYESIK